MAAFASNDVGGALARAETWKGAPAVGILAGDTYALLQTGNFLVFLDLFPQHLAYRSGGLAEINGISGLDPLQVQGWAQIDAGRQNGNASDIIAGNRLLLRHEQQNVLQQAVFGGNAARVAHWDYMTNNSIPFFPEFASPIPGHGVSFNDYRSQDPAVAANASFGDFSSRWEWIANTNPHTPNSMFDAWAAWEQQNSSIDMQRLLDDEY